MSSRADLRAKVALCLLLVAVGLTGMLPVRGKAMSEVQAKLATVAKERTVKFTTTGRKSGQPRTATIWFVVEDDHVFVQAGERARQGWLANVRDNPAVKLEFAATTLHGKAAVIADAEERQRVLELIRQKYWLARAAGWVGSRIGAGTPLRITIATGRQ